MNRTEDQASTRPPDPYVVRALDATTWPDFERFAAKHNGVWGGCWCTWFHPASDEQKSFAGARTYKERLVRNGDAHAALVFDSDNVIAWCEYGSPAELPNIYHRKEYLAGMIDAPDYRLTCFFIDTKYRRKGVAAVALRGAIALIAQSGGGVVEGYPQDVEPGRKLSSSFLYNGTRTLFERAGFEYDRPKGKGHCVMRLVVPATVR